MSSMELLFAQIFDHKNSIVDQLRHNRDFLDQSLASHLLINGIRPPPWLSSSSAVARSGEPSDADLRNLKKEELISGLLFRSQRPTGLSTVGCGTLYSHPVIKADNVRLSETCFSRGWFGPDEVPKSCTSASLLQQKMVMNGVSKLEPIASTPLAQADSEVDKIQTDLELSRAMLQRSKARQKDLELRLHSRSKGKTAECHSTNGVVGEVEIISHPCLAGDTIKSSHRMTKSRSVSLKDHIEESSKANSLCSLKETQLDLKACPPAKSVEEGNSLFNVIGGMVDPEAHDETMLSEPACDVEGDGHLVHPVLQTSTYNQVAHDDMDIFVKPKKLAFDDTEDCIYENKILSSSRKCMEGETEGELGNQFSEAIVTELEAPEFSKEGCIMKHLQEAPHLYANNQPKQEVLLITGAGDGQEDSSRASDEGRANGVLELVGGRAPGNDLQSSPCRREAGGKKASCLELTGSYDSEGFHLEKCLNESLQQAKEALIDNCDDLPANRSLGSNGLMGHEPIPSHSSVVFSDVEERLLRSPSQNLFFKEDEVIAGVSDVQCMGEMVVGLSSDPGQATKMDFDNDTHLHLDGDIYLSHADNDDYFSEVQEKDLFESPEDIVKRSLAWNLQRITPEAAHDVNVRPEVRYSLRSSPSHNEEKSCSKLNQNQNTEARPPKYTSESTWPKCKKRKTEHDHMSTSRKVKGFHPTLQIHEDSSSTHLKCLENSSGHLVRLTKNPSVEAHHSTKRRKMKVDDSLKIEDENRISSMDENAGEDSLDVEEKQHVDGDQQPCLINEMRIFEPTCEHADLNKCNTSEVQDSPSQENELGGAPGQESTRYSGDFEKVIEAMTHNARHILFSNHAVNSQESSDATSSHLDDDMHIETATGSYSPCLMEDPVIFASLDLPREKKESLPARWCRSTGMLTPVPHSSEKRKIHAMPYNGQSLPNGHLKDVNMSSSSADVSMRSGASKCGDLVNVYNISVGEDSSSMNGFYFDTVPPISSRFGWDGRRSACTPPVGKSKGSSSGSGTFNSNPSLTCFRIDEDAVMEDGQLDELDGMSLKGVMSEERKMPPSRHVLGNVTSVCQNAQVFHASTEILERSLDSVNTESDNLMQISMNHDTAKSCNFEHGYEKEAKGKENKCPSVGKNKVLRSSESLHSTISRPNLTSNACERNTSQKFSGKVLKTNNVVSNVSSFIPFVQQKQPAAGVLTGKRDIKVKALEAAEAAKRMAEKKENERKMKKEAARLERAKLEQENARQMEIKKKLKEEERKKKEVNMEARKRQREEDEKKERERKRKCVEENRRQQKEQEEKLRCEKEERLQKRKIADGKSRKETEDSKRQNNLKKEKEVSGTMDSLKMDPKNSKLSVEHFVNGSSILKDVESCKEPTEKVNSAYGLQKASGREFQDIEEEQKSQSYEISPYRDSDDEEEDEEDNRHKGKIFPPWTRTEFLFEFLRAQQHIDASKIFPRAKCFNCEDILPPRNK